MKINNNLKVLQSYNADIISKNVKRYHSNESHSTILPINTLMQCVFNDINYYPEQSYNDLIIQSAKFYNTSPNFTIAVNGSDEGLDLIIRAICNPADKIAILSPTFSMYRQYSIAFGLEVIEFDLDSNFELNIDDFITFCQKNNPKIVFIPNPLAPTGGITDTNSLTKIIQKLPNTFVVIDEAYIEFSQQQSIINLLPQYKNLVITKTLSKFFGLAGARLGFVFTQYKNEILKVKSPYNVNQISCQIGINLFKNITQNNIQNNIQNRYNQNLTSKQQTINWLKQFKQVKKIYPSNTNFIFVELNCPSQEFENIMLQQFNIKIKAFSGKFANFCRISF